MSGTDGENASRPVEVLVHYRVAGGPVDVDQRLTVFGDGAVKLDERHRSRAPVWIQLDAAERDGLRAALDAVPAHQWRRVRKVLRARMGKAFLGLFLPTPEETDDVYVQITLGSRAVIAGDDAEREVTALANVLQRFLVRAIRAERR